MSELKNPKERAKHYQEAQESAPEAQESAPKAQESAPKAQESAPKAQESAPAVKQPTREGQQPAPEAQQPAREGQQPAPSGQPPAARGRRTPEQWQDFVSQRIEEAMASGAFDNLRNKGKPLDAAPEPYTPADMQMANSLLKNNDLVPAWISERKAVLAAIDRFRTQMDRICADFQTARAEAKTPQRSEQINQLWQAQIEKWQNELAVLNRRIQNQNLQQPVTFLEIIKLRLDDELRRRSAGL